MSEKPYRVYRGGRVRGKAATLPKPATGRRADRDGRERYAGPGAIPRRRRRRWRRYVVLVIVLLLASVVAWAVASYLAVRSGVETANARLGERARAALVPQEGSLLTSETHILLLGTDSAPTRARRGLRHTDSMIVVRTDPDHNRMAYLSIPRDLRVAVPGHGFAKVNVAYQIGGAPLAIRTVRSLGLPVNHVVIVDLQRFKTLIDAVGGVTIDVRRPIRAKFECPLKTSADCANWRGWYFPKGRQKLRGRKALVFARVRKNLLNPSESDLTRGGRQQQVMQALTREMTSLGTLVRMPWIGDEVARPLATDLATGDLMILGWRRWRTGEDRTLHCRLGGTPSSFGYLLGEGGDNQRVISMFRGLSAPQPPAPGQPFAAGCRVGRALLAPQ
ncbi:MAG: LCP family protein [Thermoleophilia bacterium]|nr:LCP family protein [Thermoleophilia bacterium]